jgi:hypothetical protein
MAVTGCSGGVKAVGGRGRGAQRAGMAAARGGRGLSGRPGGHSRDEGRAWPRRGAGAAAGEVSRGEVTESERRGRRRKEKAGQPFIYLLCRVPTIWHSAKIFFNFKIMFAECQIAGTRQRRLCRVSTDRYSTKICSSFFAECQGDGTRQSLLCRVSTGWHSTKLSLPSVISKHSAKYIFIFLILVTKFFVVCSYTM